MPGFYISLLGRCDPAETPAYYGCARSRCLRFKGKGYSADNIHYRIEEIGTTPRLNRTPVSGTRLRSLLTVSAKRLPFIRVVPLVNSHSSLYDNGSL